MNAESWDISKIQCQATQVSQIVDQQRAELAKAGTNHSKFVMSMKLA